MHQYRGFMICFVVFCLVLTLPCRGFAGMDVLGTVELDYGSGGGGTQAIIAATTAVAVDEVICLVLDRQNGAPGKIRDRIDLVRDDLDDRLAGPPRCNGQG